jgi:hypothetical protein
MRERTVLVEAHVFVHVREGPNAHQLVVRAARALEPLFGGLAAQEARVAPVRLGAEELVVGVFVFVELVFLPHQLARDVVRRARHAAPAAIVLQRRVDRNPLRARARAHSSEIDTRRR